MHQQDSEQKRKFIISQEQQQHLRTGFNIFIIGFQNTGKSTLANALSDQEQLYFEKEGNYFKPINKNYFPIALSDKDVTKDPQTIIMQDYQIWDLPGYGDRENQDNKDGNAAMDIYKNRLQQIIICNQSLQSHIMITFTYSEFSGGKGENIMKLSNLLAQKDLRVSIIISRVPIKTNLDKIISLLEKSLQQGETKYTALAKQFLNQVIQENRIQIFKQPQLIGENYQYNKENLDQIKQLAFDKKNFHQIQLQYRFLDKDQFLIKCYIERLTIQLKEIEQEVIVFTIKINSSIYQILNDKELDQQKQNLQQNYEKHLGYYKLFQQVEQLELKKWNEDYLNQQLAKINDFFQQKNVKVDQQICVTCASYRLSELREIYNQNKNIKDIYIYSAIQFIVDCDIEISGVQIYIKTKQFRVINQSFINLKGQAGLSILEQARSGDEVNIHGDVGKNGSDGQPGGTFYVSAKEYFNIEEMTIDVSGGYGGIGQDGGDGFDGIKGEDGNENEVKQKKKSRQFEKCEEVPTNLFEDLFSINRVFKIYFRSKGQAGTVGGNAGGGGLGGAKGPQGIINFENLNGKQPKIINESQKGFDGINGTPGKGGQFGFDYIGEFQDVKFLGFIRKPKELKQQQKEEKLNQSKLETSELTENSPSSLTQSTSTQGSLTQSTLTQSALTQSTLTQSSLTQSTRTNNQILKKTENVVGKAAIGGVGVGAGIAVREISFQTAAKIGLGAASAVGALAVLGIQAIATGADLVIRHGWNYIKKDEENIQWASSGQIISQNDKQKDEIINKEEIALKQQQRLNYFYQFQQNVVNQITNQFNLLGLSEEQIKSIIDQ